MASSPVSVSALHVPADWRDFLALTKPGVMRLVVFTGLCGMLAAPTQIHPVLAFTAILCIAMGAGGAAALNQWYEADLDAKMKRTRGRPLPGGRMERQSALHFGVGLSVASVVLMYFAVNLLSAAILTASILYYVVVYTIWLKRRTPQNIVIGGAAGAFPPLIGWAAATGQVSLLPVLLFALVFLWTPPHFWALALFVKSDYANAGVPMLPVVAGERATRTQIGLYTVPMIAAGLAPWALGLTGAIYGVASLLLNGVFGALALAVMLRKTGENDTMKPEKRLFAWSILYLFLIFGALVADRWVLA
ncbi:heme o synthase [Stakelama tenebrarum]|uniref:Protoheme IX farnesyltransferase n=1 Tax=Stakelama tenebrarum TaxID=2711215 RepID=A0A6G6Y0A7_9SPHN|nr:heme o synthase [Sphingosinithalassobacter tenebrarum]QIG78352.1 protoheme IX farnesyltransferase [Sphingosinithalassobacter tenebrarum]